MLIHPLLTTFILFALVHTCVWFSTNSQFTNIDLLRNNSLMIALVLSIPISLMAMWAAKSGYTALNSIWSVRFLAFGVSYLIFPILTWVLLGESMLTFKTLLCIALSIIIILVQITLIIIL